MQYGIEQEVLVKKHTQMENVIRDSLTLEQKSESVNCLISTIELRTLTISTAIRVVNILN